MLLLFVAVEYRSGLLHGGDESRKEHESVDQEDLEDLGRVAFAIGFCGVQSEGLLDVRAGREAPGAYTEHHSLLGEWRFALSCASPTFATLTTSVLFLLCSHR